MQSEKGQRFRWEMTMAWVTADLWWEHARRDQVYHWGKTACQKEVALRHEDSLLPMGQPRECHLQEKCHSMNGRAIAGRGATVTGYLQMKETP